jgi:hypothetical protein
MELEERNRNNLLWAAAGALALAVLSFLAGNGIK